MIAGVLAGLIVAAWLLPFYELICFTVGLLREKGSPPSTAGVPPKRLIIQYTTRGSETMPILLGNTRRAIKSLRRAYHPTLDVELWVILDAEASTGSPASGWEADRVFYVPSDFRVASKFKARALEYSRLQRLRLGYSDPETRVILLDDDTWVDTRYLRQAVRMKESIAQGFTNTNNLRGWWTLFDAIRVHTCKVFCRFYNRLYPLWVHGEGLTYTADLEQHVTWGRHATSSAEDLVFGHEAKRLGFRWGYFDRQIHGSSPLNFRDYVKQRMRWAGGHLVALRSFLPFWSKIFIIGHYLAGLIFGVVSLLGILLWLTGQFAVTPPLSYATTISLAAWWGLWFYSGYQVHGVKYGLGVMLLAHVITALHAGILLYAWIHALLHGVPQTFEVIEKRV